MDIQGITWHAIVLEADEYAATRALLTETFGLSPALDTPAYAMFPMENGTIVDLIAPEAVPPYGFNDGVVFGFRVPDIEVASAQLEDAGCELLGEITRLEEMSYAYRHFRGPDGRVYGINEQK
jgi:predicted enzyme related to lactoylglutathione lyase